MRRWAGIVLLLFGLIVAPARAGTYEVVACSAPGANGVNNSWTPVQTLEGTGQGVLFAVRATCPGGLAASTSVARQRSNYLSRINYTFVAPAGTTIVALRATRYLYGEGLADNPSTPEPDAGRWDLYLQDDTSSPVGGAFGREQCTAVVSRASGKTITVSVSDGASGVAGGTISVRNAPSEPFRALPTSFANGRLTAKLDRGDVGRVGIAVNVTDNAGNATAGELSELSLRVGGRALSGGAASVSYDRSAVFSGRLTTRDGVAVGGQAVAVEQTSRVAGSSPTVVATVTTDAKGRFSYRAPAGPSRRLRFLFAGDAGRLAPLARTAQLRVRASSTITASPRTLRGGGRVRFSGRLGVRGATVPRSGKLVDLQAYDGGRWRTFATARARGSKGAWSSSYRFAGQPGRYPIRLRIRREDVFPYDLGYSRSVIVRVR